MTKLTAVYLNRTSHVLAALTRTDPPQTAEPVSALIGTGLLVRFIGQLLLDVTFYARDLSVVTVDDQPDVVVNPQGYQVVQDPVTRALQVTGVGASGQVTLTIDTTSGAAVTVNMAGSLPAIVVLQKVKPTSSPPVIVPLLTVPLGSAIAMPASAFASGDNWNMYALVQTLPPVSQAIPVM